MLVLFSLHHLLCLPSSSSWSSCSRFSPVSWPGDQIADKLPTVESTLAWLNWPLPVHLLKASLCWAGRLSWLWVEQKRDMLCVRVCVFVCVSVCALAHIHGMHHCPVRVQGWHQQDKEANEGCRGIHDRGLASCGEFQCDGEWKRFLGKR